MSQLTRKQFANKAGIKQSSLNVYLSRGLIVMNESGKIDTNHPDNELFLSNHNPKAKEQARSLNAEKKALEIERLKGEIRLSEIKRQKMDGNLLPYDLVKDVMIRANKNLLSAFKDQFNTMVRDLERQKIISSSQREQYSKKMVEVVNAASQAATRANHKDIDNFIETLEHKKK